MVKVRQGNCGVKALQCIAGRQKALQKTGSYAEKRSGAHRTGASPASPARCSTEPATLCTRRCNTRSGDAGVSCQFFHLLFDPWPLTSLLCVFIPSCKKEIMNFFSAYLVLFW